MMTVPQTIEIARKYLGVRQYSPQHQQLVATYNETVPRPRGYKVTLDDDWCDIFVTAIADLAGASQYTGRECGVERHLVQMRQMGIWQGRTFPQVGDIIVFDYNGGMADHIGYVETVDEAGNIQTIEGNVNGAVARQHYHYLDSIIVGYARPHDSKVIEKLETTLSEQQLIQIARRVIRGEFGNGEERKRLLHLFRHA